MARRELRRARHDVYHNSREGLPSRHEFQTLYQSSEKEKVKPTGFAKPSVGGDGGRQGGHSQGELHVCSCSGDCGDGIEVVNNLWVLSTMMWECKVEVEGAFVVMMSEHEMLAWELLPDAQ